MFSSEKGYWRAPRFRDDNGFPSKHNTPFKGNLASKINLKIFSAKITSQKLFFLFFF